MFIASCKSQLQPFFYLSYLFNCSADLEIEFKDEGMIWGQINFIINYLLILALSFPAKFKFNANISN